MKRLALKAPAVTLSVAIAALAASCSPKAKDQASPYRPDPVIDPITSAPLSNCRFQNPEPTYSYQVGIEPNTILCDEGVPTKVELLNDSPLPSGLRFDSNQLALVGTANEKVVAAPYQFYLKNEAGYRIISLKISIK